MLLTFSLSTVLAMPPIAMSKDLIKANGGRWGLFGFKFEHAVAGM